MEMLLVARVILYCMAILVIACWWHVTFGAYVRAVSLVFGRCGFEMCGCLEGKLIKKVNVLLTLVRVYAATRTVLQN